MRSWPLVPLAFAAALAGACGDPTGSVELAWVFVDRGGDPIFPGGVFSIDDEHDTCNLPGQLGDMPLTYDLRVELEICEPDCEGGCDAEECLVMPRRTFACNAARGNEPEVPASDIDYRFTLRAVLSAPSVGVECRDAEPTCLAVPAPRQRAVTAGKVTDLQVNQIAVDVDRSAAERLNLGDCGCA